MKLQPFLDKLLFIPSDYLCWLFHSPIFCNMDVEKVNTIYWVRTPLSSFQSVRRKPGFLVGALNLLLNYKKGSRDIYMTRDLNNFYTSFIPILLSVEEWLFSMFLLRFCAFAFLFYCSGSTWAVVFQEMFVSYSRKITLEYCDQISLLMSKTWYETWQLQI